MASGADDEPLDTTTVLNVELEPINGKVGFTVTGGRLQSGNVGFDPKVRVGELLGPPALGSPMRPQDRILAVNGREITSDIDHDQVVDMVIQAAAAGTVTFRLARSSMAPARISEPLDSLATPFYVRAAAAWMPDAALPRRPSRWKLLPFASSDVLEVLNVKPFADDDTNQHADLWWLARKVEVGRGSAAEMPSDGGPADTDNDVGIVPCSYALQEHVALTEQHHAYTRAARAERRISGDTQAVPMSYQHLVRMDAEDYRAALGMRPLCLFGPSTFVDLVTQYLFTDARKHGFRCVHPVHATTRAPRLGEVDGVDYHFWSPDEAERRIDRGEVFVVDATDGNDGQQVIFGLPIESILRPAANNDVVVLREVDGASMTALSHLVQRTGTPEIGCQPVIVYLDPDFDACKPSPTQGDRESTTLTTMVEGLDGLSDPGLMATRLQASRDLLVYGHLYTAVVSCAQPLSAVVADIFSTLRKETAHSFWGMKSYTLPRGLAQKRAERMVVLSPTGTNGTLPFVPFGRYWADGTSRDAALMVNGGTTSEVISLGTWHSDGQLHCGDEVLEINGRSLAGMSWHDRRDAYITACQRHEPVRLLVRHNPGVFDQIAAEEYAAKRSSRKSSLMSDTNTVHSSEGGSPKSLDGLSGVQYRQQRASVGSDRSSHRVSRMPDLENLGEEHGEDLITLVKKDGVFGIEIRSLDGRDPRVSRIVPDTAAASSPINIGDHILRVNGIDTSTGVHHDVLLALDVYDEVTLTVRPDAGYCQYLHTLNMVAATQPLHGSDPADSSMSSLTDSAISLRSNDARLPPYTFELELVRGMNDTMYGMGLAGPPTRTSTPRRHHQIIDIRPGGVAHRAHLMVGDAFVVANGIDTSTLSHHEFKELLLGVQRGSGIYVKVQRSFALLQEFQSSDRSPSMYTAVSPPRGNTIATAERKPIYHDTGCTLPDGMNGTGNVTPLASPDRSGRSTVTASRSGPADESYPSI
eukprot:m.17495 g.17495  ORF g.17495 m.17495 type:complete len:981 (+) comp3504_c0_seq1:427-3369(+)